MVIVDKLTDWFLNSRIFNGESYLSYYSQFRNGPAYPEISSYAISLACILYNERRDKRFIERAHKCTEYMININRNGAVPCFADNNLYTFDTGIFISGIFDLYAIDKNQKYIDEAKKSLKWIYKKWDSEKILAGEVNPPKEYWYKKPSVHLTKLAISLIKASKYIGDKKYEKNALKLLDRYKKLQNENGSFRIIEGSNEIMTHPHCYATEGFLYAYHTLRNQEYLEIAKKASEWLCKIQNSDGSFYRQYFIEENDKLQKNPIKLKTSDATAQATRIWKLLGVNRNGIDKDYKYLDSELKSNGLRLLKSDSLSGKLSSWQRAIFSWPTFFYIHSLILPFGNQDRCEELF